MTATDMSAEISVALLTGGSDRPYVFGLTTSLISKGACLDLIGSDELDFPEFRSKPGVNFLNLRGEPAGCQLRKEGLQGVDVLCQADSLCCDSQAEDLSYPVE